MNEFTFSLMSALSDDLERGYDSDLAEFYDESYVDSATEGFGADFKDNVSAYMKALQDINNEIPKAIADSDAKRLREYANKGVKLCDQFRNELKKMPKDKFASIRNLMPCFRSLMTIGGIILSCGGAAALGKVPALAPVKSVATKLLGEGEGFGKKNIKLPGIIRAIALFKMPLLSAFINGSAKPDTFFGKLFKGASYAGAAITIFKSVKASINQVTNENKYAKMVRAEDKDDENSGNRQYMAMLGQIEEMTASYKALISDADNIIAAANDSNKQATESLTFVYECLLELHDDSEAHEIFMSAFAEALTPATEAMSVSGLDALFNRYNAVFKEVDSKIALALRTKDQKSLDQVCKQGIHTCNRLRADLKKLPPDQFAKMKNFVPNMVVISCLWSIFMCIADTYRLNSVVFSKGMMSTVNELGIELSKSVLSSGPANSLVGNASEEEIMDAAQCITELFDAISDGLTVSAQIMVLPSYLFKRSKPFITTIIQNITTMMKESNYALLYKQSDRDDPNIANKKYRAALNQVDAMIYMYTDIQKAGIRTETVAKESWL